MMRTTTGAALALVIGFGLVPQTARAQDPTDTEIAAIVVAANAADSANGELALNRATEPKVREFARQMVEAHTAVNQAAVQLVTELGVTPQPNGTSRGIANGQAAERQELEKLTGLRFDRAYIANEVAYHEAVLNAMDHVLIPGAENERLRQTLKDVRPAFVAHLEQAKQIQTELGGRERASM